VKASRFCCGIHAYPGRDGFESNVEVNDGVGLLLLNPFTEL
jgi:hypothetical protein